MAFNYDSKETAQKTPPKVEAIDKFISDKQTEKVDAGRAVVMNEAKATQNEVANVMAGMEKIRENVPESAGETGEKGDLQTGGGQMGDAKQAAQVAVANLGQAIPSQEDMVQKIRTAIVIQIEHEMKKAQKLEKNLAMGSAQEYNATITKIRHLKNLFQSVLHDTFEFVKATYFKYFHDNGRRKRFEEI